MPGLGSHVFLSVLVTSAVLAPDEPIKERCGACTRCLDACPTRAFVGPRQLDARACIAYLTIEQRGAVPLSLRDQLGDWLFGCDVCQDVCPLNATEPPPAEQTEPFASHARWQEHDTGALLAMDDESFAAYAQGSPIKRAGRVGMARNAAIVLGNTRDKRHLPVLETPPRSTTAPWYARPLPGPQTSSAKPSGSGLVVRLDAPVAVQHGALAGAEKALLRQVGGGMLAQQLFEAQEDETRLLPGSRPRR